MASTRLEVCTTHRWHKAGGDSSGEAVTALSQLTDCKDIPADLGKGWEGSFPSTSSSERAEQTRFQMLLPHCAMGPPRCSVLSRI